MRHASMKQNATPLSQRTLISMSKVFSLSTTYEEQQEVTSGKEKKE